MSLPSGVAPGLYAVRVYGAGYRTAAPFNLQVTSPPAVSVTITPSAASLQGGQTQQFTAVVSNTSNTAVTWSIAPSGVGAISTAGLYTAPTTIISPQTVTVTATSQADNTRTAAASITLNPPVSVTFTTAPPGLSIMVDGTTCVAVGTACTFNWAPGTSHTIAAVTPQAAGDGTQYVFANWSDSGAQSHTLTAPTSAATYAASFATQYYLTTIGPDRWQYQSIKRLAQ